MGGFVPDNDVTAGAAALHGAGLWIALHLLLLLGLSARVVVLRLRHRVSLGDGDVPELTRAGRAFGNAAEYTPSGLVAVLALALLPAPLLVHAVGGLLFAGRLVHAFGLSRFGGISFGRTAGMVLTWTAYGVAAASLLLFFAL